MVEVTESKQLTISLPAHVYAELRELALKTWNERTFPKQDRYENTESFLTDLIEAFLKRRNAERLLYYARRMRMASDTMVNKRPKRVKQGVLSL